MAATMGCNFFDVALVLGANEGATTESKILSDIREKLVIPRRAEAVPPWLDLVRVKSSPTLYCNWSDALTPRNTIRDRAIRVSVYEVPRWWLSFREVERAPASLAICK